jgi:hypothetical protein
MNESKSRNIISLLAVVSGIVLARVGYSLPSGLEQSIVVNIASNFMTTGIFSFLILDRILSAQENRNKRQEKETLDRNQQPIEVFLFVQNSPERFKLPLELLRGEFSRAELQARIGMLPIQNQSGRFAFEYNGDTEFFTQINDITTNKSNRLEIRCSTEEIQQFKMYKQYKFP